MKTNPELWSSLCEFRFHAPNTAFSLADRLARENGWTPAFVDRVLEEYRRFLYLSQTAGHSITPSEEVDQVWHLHLCYTESYWKDLCRDTLDSELHHGPTKGGEEEREKFFDWYSRTLESYRREFSEEPPADIWPSPEVRFRPNRHEWVDRGKNFVVPKSAVWLTASVALLGLVSVGCEKLMSDADAMSLVFVSVFLLVLVICVVWLFKGGHGGGGKSGGCGGCGGFGGGCGGGGCGGGCGD